MTKSGSASITATSNTVVLGNGRADFKGKGKQWKCTIQIQIQKKFLYKNNVTPNIIKFVEPFIITSFWEIAFGRICNKKVIFQINLMSFLFE